MNQLTTITSPYKKQFVVVVDDNDTKLGLADLLTAHKQNGIMHRAISIVLYRRKQNDIELLLQQRSNSKPLWPLLWTNTVCTHPRDGESYEDCAIRRLKEEMGITISKDSLRFVYRLRYAAQFSSEFSENELDSIYVGQWDGMPKVNPQEVAGFRFMSWKHITADIQNHPELYTPWFQMLIAQNILGKSIGVTL